MLSDFSDYNFLNEGTKTNKEKAFVFPSSYNERLTKSHISHVVINSEAFAYNKQNSEDEHNVEVGDHNMDNNDWTKQYIDHVDREMTELRREMIDSRKETQASVERASKGVEEKIEKVLEKFEDAVKESQRQTKEQRSWLVGTSVGTLIALVALVAATIIGITQIIVSLK